MNLISYHQFKFINELKYLFKITPIQKKLNDLKYHNTKGFLQINHLLDNFLTLDLK